MRRMTALLFIGVVMTCSVTAQQELGTGITFLSEGSTLKGRIFSRTEGPEVPTVLLVPGWPGNPTDVIGMGFRLQERGLNVMMFHPRGIWGSEGRTTFAHTMEDIGAALRFLHDPETIRRFRIDTTEIILAGHSFGGGMALAYAAQNPQVRRVISFAGNDHGVWIRRVMSDSEYGDAMRGLLEATRMPRGPANVDVEETLKELEEGQDIYGLRENAARLADRRILLLGGWEDDKVTVEDVLLPLYRKLKENGAKDVTFKVYHCDHGFSQVRDQVADDVYFWIMH